MKRWMVLIALIVGTALGAHAIGDSPALEIAIGIQGCMSYIECGVIPPTIGESVAIGLKVRGMSSVTWATLIHEDGRSVSVHPVVVGGIVSVGGASPLLDDAYRMYGGMDFLLGYTFTPWDNLIYRTVNLIGKNLTVGFWGYAGIELFTAETLSYRLDSGGGYKTLVCDEDNLYAIASGWLGSGFGIRTGLRAYSE